MYDVCKVHTLYICHSVCSMINRMSCTSTRVVHVPHIHTTCMLLRVHTSYKWSRVLHYTIEHFLSILESGLTILSLEKYTKGETITGIEVHNKIDTDFISH